jgi:endonuclease/exonuclease/phosphatase family metal-dependent hydrolase
VGTSTAIRTVWPLPAAGGPATHASHVRVCTWNIQLGRRIDAVVDVVAGRHDFHGLDLLCLQEASIHSGREDAARIAEALGDGYRHFQATAQLLRGREQGNALVWRHGSFQPGPPEVVSLKPVGHSKLGRPERALLRAVRPQQRMAIRAESADLRVYVMHLDVIGFAHKLEQLKAVIGDSAAREHVPMTIVAGDLNTFGHPQIQPWRRIAGAARDAGLVDVTSRIRSTHWTSQKLDAIFVRADAGVSHRAWTLDVRASDHRPVFAEISGIEA